MCVSQRMAEETGGGGGDREVPSLRVPLIPFPGGNPGDSIYNENESFFYFF